MDYQLVWWWLFYDFCHQTNCPRQVHYAVWPYFPSFTLYGEVIIAKLSHLKHCSYQGIFWSVSAVQNKQFNLTPQENCHVTFKQKWKLETNKTLMSFYFLWFFFVEIYVFLYFAPFLTELCASLSRLCSWYFLLSNLPEQMVPSGKLWKGPGVWLCLALPSLLGSQMTSHQTSFPPLRAPWSSGSRVWCQRLQRPFAVRFSSNLSPQRALVWGESGIPPIQWETRVSLRCPPPFPAAPMTALKGPASAVK